MAYGKWFLRETRDLPALLIVHGKHDNGYFHIPTPEILAETALAIVSSRLKSGHIYDDGGVEPKRPDVGDVPSLPAALQTEAKKILGAWKFTHDYWQSRRDEWTEVQKAVDLKDGELAWEILRNSNSEYQRVSLERYSDLKHNLTGF